MSNTHSRHFTTTSQPSSEGGQISSLSPPSDREQQQQQRQEPTPNFYSSQAPKEYKLTTGEKFRRALHLDDTPAMKQKREVRRGEGKWGSI